MVLQQDNESLSLCGVKNLVDRGHGFPENGSSADEN
jgi:hypothetical protein